MGNVDWVEQWHAIFPWVQYTPHAWITHFGVDIELVAYVWDTYHDRSALAPPQHLLLILNFLKTYPLGEELAARFRMSVASVYRILWTGLETLAFEMDEVCLLSATSPLHQHFRSASGSVTFTLPRDSWLMRG